MCAIYGDDFEWCEQFVGDNLKYLEVAASDLVK